MRRVSRSTIVGVLVALSALTAQSAAAADEPAAAPQPATSLRASAVAAAGASVHSLALPQEPDQLSQAPDEPRAFFKSPRGLVVLTGIVGTAAYVLYSKSHDRVRSPIN
jgi:hypothetical protein